MLKYVISSDIKLVFIGRKEYVSTSTFFYGTLHIYVRRPFSPFILMNRRRPYFSVQSLRALHQWLKDT